MAKSAKRLNASAGRAKRPLNAGAGIESAPEKAPIGRPPLEEKARRTIMVRVLTSKAEYAEMLKAAEAAGVGISTWMRVVALKEARRGPGAV
ncbi:MAG: hypothetical protein HY369_02865 [Candidatus Aenigmarchaeota archaeon]|nr:hypothetical protein [Candidatus Aenigmarchaeota archaeon]